MELNNILQSYNTVFTLRSVGGETNHFLDRAGYFKTNMNWGECEMGVDVCL